MARTKNPFGDPVSVFRKRNIWRVRYYPTGFITDPKDRTEHPISHDSKAAAQRAAAVLRRSLIERRNAYAPGANNADAPLSHALARYVRELRDGMASRMIPDGTGKARISDVSRGLRTLCDKREFRVRDLEGDAARSVVAQLARGNGHGGAPKAANTLRKEKVSINNFGMWLQRNGYLDQNPFLFLAAETNEGRFAKKAKLRVRALTRVNQESYSPDDDDDTGIGLDDVPTLDVVSQLGPANRIIESRRTALIVLYNKALSPDAAWQTSHQPMFDVATGLRLNETLGLDTSRIELAACGKSRQKELARGTISHPERTLNRAPTRSSRQDSPQRSVSRRANWHVTMGRESAHTRTLVREAKRRIAAVFATSSRDTAHGNGVRPRSSSLECETATHRY